MTKQYCIKRAIAAMGCCTALASTVWAQVAPQSEELQEIVVTAEKRESTVQKTPISITAISGTDLQAQGGLSDMASVAQQVPGVSFKTSGPRPNGIRDAGTDLHRRRVANRGLLSGRCGVDMPPRWRRMARRSLIRACST